VCGVPYSVDVVSLGRAVRGSSPPLLHVATSGGGPGPSQWGLVITGTGDKDRKIIPIGSKRGARRHQKPPKQGLIRPLTPFG